LLVIPDPVEFDAQRRRPLEIVENAELVLALRGANVLRRADEHEFGSRLDLLGKPAHDLRGCIVLQVPTADRDGGRRASALDSPVDVLGFKSSNQKRVDPVDHDQSAVDVPEALRVGASVWIVRLGPCSRAGVYK